MSDERNRAREDEESATSAFNAADRLRYTITQDREQRDRAGALSRIDAAPAAAHPRTDDASDTATSVRDAAAGVVAFELRTLQRQVDARLDRRPSEWVAPTRQGVLQALRETRRAEGASPQLRVVMGDKLRARQHPDTRAPVSRVVERGTVVRALERRRSWTLIELDGGDAGAAQAWVYNKYLQPLASKTR